MQIFGFTEEQLWGPSEMRNKVVPLDPKLFDYNWGEFDRQYHGLRGVKTSDWLKSIGFDTFSNNGKQAYRALHKWMGLVEEGSRVAVRIPELEGKPVEKYSKEDFDKLLGIKKDLKYETSPRYILQTLGTEYGRALVPTIWADVARRTAQKILAEGGSYDRTKGHVPGEQRPAFVIISDGRFRNELLGVKAMGGAAVLIVNPAEKGADFSGHVSEKEQESIPEWWYTCKIINDKSFGVDKLHRIVLEVGNYLGMWRPTSFGHGGR